MSERIKKGSSTKIIIAQLATAIARHDPKNNNFYYEPNSVQSSAALTGASLVNAAGSLVLAATANSSWVLSGFQITSAGGTVATLAAATGTLTGSSSAAPSDGDTVVINGKTYTFKTTLTTAPGVEGQVHIGTTGSTDAAYTNLGKALALSGTNGTDYWAAAKNPWVSGVEGSHNLVLTALAPGAFGNAITTTAAGTAPGSFGGATLSGGTGLTVQVLDGTTVVFNGSIAAAGQEKFVFSPPLKGSISSSMTINTGAGGSGVFVFINAQAYTQTQ